MKKLFLLLVLVILGTTSYSQKKPIESEQWISESLDHLYFKDGAVYFNFDGSDRHKPKYTIDNDTIKMIDAYKSSIDNFTKEHTDVFKFIIRYFDGKRLQIQAVGTDATKLAGPEKMEFKNLKSSVDNSIKFSKIHFLSSTCYNGCPQLGIDIWADGTYNLVAVANAQPYSGIYTGKLNRNQLDTLNNLLKHSELKKMYDWKQITEVADAPDYVFDIDLVNNKNMLIINTNAPPLNLIGLVNFMMSSYQKIKLSPVK